MYRLSKSAGGLFKAAMASLAFLAVSACDIQLPGSDDSPKVSRSGAVTVALLVPSGSGNPQVAALSDSLIKAAQMANADLGGNRINLKVYSTAGSASRAAEQTRQALNDGAKIIIGPLFAEAANAAGVAASGQGVNVLAFSNNSQIAGGNVFILGNSFQNIADRLVFFGKSRGINNVAVAARSDVVGEIGANAVRAAAQKARVNFTGLTSYDFNPASVTAAAPRIVANVRNTGTEMVVFTADNAGALPLLTQLLPEQGLSPAQVKFAGLTRWDIPSHALNQPGMQGGWFTMPDMGPYNSFQSRYQGRYGSKPHPLAGLAYDGVAAVGTLLDSRSTNALSRSNLTRRSGFAGVSGVFRFNADGTSQRALAVAEVRNGRAEIVDPAPRKFGRLGF